MGEHAAAVVTLQLDPRLLEPVESMAALTSKVGLDAVNAAESGQRIGLPGRSATTLLARALERLEVAAQQALPQFSHRTIEAGQHSGAAEVDIEFPRVLQQLAAVKAGLARCSSIASLRGPCSTTLGAFLLELARGLTLAVANTCELVDRAEVHRGIIAARKAQTAVAEFAAATGKAQVTTTDRAFREAVAASRKLCDAVAHLTQVAADRNDSLGEGAVDPASLLALEILRKAPPILLSALRVTILHPGSEAASLKFTLDRISSAVSTLEKCFGTRLHIRGSTLVQTSLGAALEHLLTEGTSYAEAAIMAARSVVATDDSALQRLSLLPIEIQRNSLSPAEQAVKICRVVTASIGHSVAAIFDKVQAQLGDGALGATLSFRPSDAEIDVGIAQLFLLADIHASSHPSIDNFTRREVVRAAEASILAIRKSGLSLKVQTAELYFHVDLLVEIVGEIIGSSTDGASSSESPASGLDPKGRTPPRDNQANSQMLVSSHPLSNRGLEGEFTEERHRMAKEAFRAQFGDIGDGTHF